MKKSFFISVSFCSHFIQCQQQELWVLWKTSQKKQLENVLTSLTLEPRCWKKKKNKNMFYSTSNEIYKRNALKEISSDKLKLNLFIFSVILSTFLITVNSIFFSWKIQTFLMKYFKTTQHIIQPSHGFSQHYYTKNNHSQIHMQSVSYSQSYKACSVMLKWQETCNSWVSGVSFSLEKNFILWLIKFCVFIIIIRRGRHSIVYTHGSNLRTPFIILLSCSLQ